MKRLKDWITCVVYYFCYCHNCCYTLLIQWMHIRPFLCFFFGVNFITQSLNFTKAWFKVELHSWFVDVQICLMSGSFCFKYKITFVIWFLWVGFIVFIVRIIVVFVFILVFTTFLIVNLLFVVIVVILFVV